jgi:hypothetical protein
MGEDVAWTAVALGEGDLGGWVVASEEPPEVAGRGVAGDGVRAAREDGGGDQGLWVVARRGHAVDPVVAAHERPVAQARVDGVRAEAQGQQLLSRHIARLPRGQCPHRRIHRVLGDIAPVRRICSHIY